MRKVILGMLVLAVLALFAVGCQPTQPQAGQAWNFDRRAQTDYGFAAPIAREPAMPSSEISYRHDSGIEVDWEPGEERGTISYRHDGSIEIEWEPGEERISMKLKPMPSGLDMAQVSTVIIDGHAFMSYPGAGVGNDGQIGIFTDGGWKPISASIEPSIPPFKIDPSSPIGLTKVWTMWATKDGVQSGYVYR